MLRADVPPDFGIRKISCPVPDGHTADSIETRRIGGTIMGRIRFQLFFFANSFHFCLSYKLAGVDLRNLPIT